MDHPPNVALDELAASTCVPAPGEGRPYTDCSAVMVVWNEEKRLPGLMKLLRHWFTHTVIGVQDSSDETLAIAKRLPRHTDQILQEPHYGYGDASMPRLVAAAVTPWVFVVAADEWPSDELLASLWTATAYADANRYDGVWIPFQSVTDGIPATDTQSGHLRLFRQTLGWPAGMHSRPSSTRDLWWPHGNIAHRRSLDEMVKDYLRYLAIGKDNAGWSAHNRLMLHDACAGVAAVKGWSYVCAYGWWPQVRAEAFAGQDPV